MNQDTQRSIAEMNLAYLLLIQRLLAEDRSAAMKSLGVSPEVADLLVVLSLSEITRLASVSQILCSFRFQDHAFLSALTHRQVEAAAMNRASGVAPSRSAVAVHHT